MSTVLYPSPVFGPVKSRRLGISLGINLMPADGKICTFDCIYCECGFNDDHRPKSHRPTPQEVLETLETVLQRMNGEGQLPDVITFAGNGEPTAHPQFETIIDDVLRLRSAYAPLAKVSVLSNGMHIHNESVFRALMKVDNNIQKLDTANLSYIMRVNRPRLKYSVENQVELMARFNGHVIIQTMFMKGSMDGEDVSNVSEEYVKPWLEALQKIQPSQVMIYTIDRETPARGLQKATREDLDDIVRRVQALGISASASY